MIIVTGTMRSGTSMWMQILQASGFPVLGAEFPGKWKERIGEANAGGFYESSLRDGIYYRTNPHPVTGVYLRPDETRQHAVKIFAQGLVRSDVAFLHRVLLSVRPFREFAASLARLMEMERRAKSEERGHEVPLPAHIPHALRWWDDNFSAFRDALIRGYPTHAMAYDTVLSDSEALARTLRWLGAPKVEEGLSRVKAERRTQENKPASSADVSPEADAEHGLPAEAIAVFDELYERVESSRGFDPSFVQRMNALDAELQPRISAERERVQGVMAARRQKRRAAAERSTPLGPGKDEAASG